MGKHLWDFLPDFMIALEKQLQEDEKKHGDAWMQQTREGQEERIYNRYWAYLFEFKTKQTPIPWLKVAGLALIAWIRDSYRSNPGA